MGSEYIIKYLSDITDIVQGASRVDSINKQMANTLTGEYSKAVRTIGNTVSKITDKKVKIKVEIDGKKALKEVDQRVTQTTQVVQTANGKFQEFSQTVTTQDGVFKKMSGSLKDVTGQYKRLATETEKQKKNLKAVAGASSGLATNFNNLKDINNKYASSLKDVGQASRVVGQSINKVSGNVTTVGHVVQTANGKFIQLTEVMTKTADGGRTVKRSMKDVSNQYSKTAIETEKSKKGFVGMAENMKRLASRALLTIPIWIALRGAVQAVSKTLRDGVGALIDQDRALQKARRNLQGTSEEISQNFDTLKKSARQFSLETGESVVNVITAFQRFATTGLDFETSMRGALASTKTAVLLFGETEQIANAVARSFRVLGGRTDEFTSKGDELESLLSLISELWNTNAFEIDEFASAIERIAPTAKNANVSLRETTVLLGALHTAGIRSSRSGRLLSTAIIKMNKNFDQFGKTLGVNLRSVDSTFERLLLITGAIENLHDADPVKASQAIGTLFGIRAGESIKGLTALNAEIREMIKVTGDVGKFNNEFEEMQKQTFRQVEIFKNLRIEIGKAFLVGVTGGEDFNESLLSINEEMATIEKRAKTVGTALNTAFGFIGVEGELNLFEKIFKKQFDELDEKTKKRMENIYKLLSPTTALEGVIDLFGDIGADNVNLDEFTKETERQIKDAVESAFSNTKQKGASEAKPTVVQEADRSKIAEAVLKHELDRLKTRGLLNSEILRAEEIMRKQLSIEEEGLSIVEKKLENEKAIRAEKELQTRLSSRSIKLFEIAKEFGTPIAKKLSEVLSGEVDFGGFVKRGGEAVEIFKEKFGNIFTDLQAQAFLKGITVPGEKGLRGGAGVTIPLADEGIINAGISMAKTSALMKSSIDTFKTAVEKFASSSDKPTPQTAPKLSTSAGSTPDTIFTPDQQEQLEKDRPKGFVTFSRKKDQIQEADKFIKEKPITSVPVQSDFLNESIKKPQEAESRFGRELGEKIPIFINENFLDKSLLKLQEMENRFNRTGTSISQQISPNINVPVNVPVVVNLDISKISEVGDKVIETVTQEIARKGSKISQTISERITGSLLF